MDEWKIGRMEETKVNPFNPRKLPMTALKQKILNKTAKVGIIGLGYVGR